MSHSFPPPSLRALLSFSPSFSPPTPPPPHPLPCLIPSPPPLCLSPSLSPSFYPPPVPFPLSFLPSHLSPSCYSHLLLKPSRSVSQSSALNVVCFLSRLMRWVIFGHSKQKLWAACCFLFQKDHKSVLFYQPTPWKKVAYSLRV